MYAIYMNRFSRMYNNLQSLIIGEWIPITYEKMADAHEIKFAIKTERGIRLAYLHEASDYLCLIILKLHKLMKNFNINTSMTVVF